MKNRVTFFRALFFSVVGVIMLFSGNTLAQQRITDMTQTFFSGGYSTIVGQPGTVTQYQLPSNSQVYYHPTQLPALSGGLPFAFRYDGTSYSQGTTVYYNFGFITFNLFANYYYNVLNPSTQYPAIPATGYPNVIAAVTGLQVAYNSGASYPSTNNGGIYTLVSGTAPNRVWTIEWNKFGDYNVSSRGAVSYQIRLFETTNAIEIVF